MATCLCGERIPVSLTQGRPKKYCSNACRQRAFRNSLPADERRRRSQKYSKPQPPHVLWERGYRDRAIAFGYEPHIESFTREELIAYWGNGERCIYCDGPFEHTDHKIPVAWNGPHTIENVVPSCGPCNGASGGRSIANGRIAMLEYTS